MPYIHPDRRIKITEGAAPDTAGELNYKLYTTCLRYLKEGDKEWCYQTFNDIIGALEGCKLELYRQYIAPYEEEKIVQNGPL